MFTFRNKPLLVLIFCIIAIIANQNECSEEFENLVSNPYRVFGIAPWNDPFFNALQKMINLICSICLCMFIIYLILRCMYKAYQKVWKIILIFAVTFIFIDNLLPHYFMSLSSQYFASTMVSLILYYFKSIWRFIFKSTWRLIFRKVVVAEAEKKN
jgi:hypothetical protein